MVTNYSVGMVSCYNNVEEEKREYNQKVIQQNTQFLTRQIILESEKYT